MVKLIMTVKILAACKKKKEVVHERSLEVHTHRGQAVTLKIAVSVLRKRTQTVVSGELNTALRLCSTFEQAQKNVFLEERVQVLQQQNEDLKARIEMNLSLSR